MSQIVALPRLLILVLVLLTSRSLPAISGPIVPDPVGIIVIESPPSATHTLSELTGMAIDDCEGVEDVEITDGWELGAPLSLPPGTVCSVELDLVLAGVTPLGASETIEVTTTLHGDGSMLISSGDVLELTIGRQDGTGDAWYRSGELLIRRSESLD